MKGLINFADILPKNQHIKKNVLSVKMYVIALGLLSVHLPSQSFIKV